MDPVEIPAELLAELHQLEAPTPETHFVHLRGGAVVHELRPELVRFLSAGVRALGAAVTDSPAPSVYATLDDTVDRVGALVEHDAAFRTAVTGDLGVLGRFLATGTAEPTAVPALLRALNRLRITLSRAADVELAEISFALVSALLADLLEIATFT